MNLYLIDGTYELFRSHFGAPPREGPDGEPIGAAVGLLQSLLRLLRERKPDFAACAFDSVIESFRNDLFAGYKTGEGVPDDLLSQFALAEDAAAALGIAVWRMAEFEADDAIATAARRWKDAPGVERTVICSVDKDLMNLAEGTRVILWDRRRETEIAESDVIARFGVPPASIPDYLALVGDSADGIPGLRGWGAKGTAAALSEYRRLEDIPDSHEDWRVKVRSARSLARTLAENRESANLYKTLATLRTDVPLSEDLSALRWRGVPRAEYRAFCERLSLTPRIADAPDGLWA